jgi:hypothetical protein
LELSQALRFFKFFILDMVEKQLSSKFFNKIKNLTLNFGPQHPAAHGVLR